jgi:hypothetical protein
LTFVALLLANLSATARADILTFSTGEVTPETISQAPAGFGSFGGSYFVTDIGAPPTGSQPNTIWVVPAAGGAPSVFTQFVGTGADAFRGGLFLPSSFGSFGGDFVVGGSTSIRAYAPNATFGVLADSTSTGYGQLTSPAIAPSGFGSAGGNLFFTAQVGPLAPNTGGVIQVTPGGVASVFFAAPSGSPFGIAFAPTGFGSVGGNMLVSFQDGTIESINANGQASTFSVIPNIPAGAGLRQLAFAPSNFGALSGDLIVSVSGSFQGGGQLGTLYALDSSGRIVAVLKAGSVLSKFDPRGVAFTSDGHILINDAADPILIALPSDFVAPEPSSMVLLGIGVGALVLWRKRV